MTDNTTAVTKTIFQFGVPTVALFFVLYFMVLPLITALVKNVETQTVSMQEIAKQMKVQSDYMQMIERRMENQRRNRN
jgi:hypothetical protein